MPSQLPDRPNLEQLKKQAKSLLACGAGRAIETSLRRFAALPVVREQVHRSDRALDLALHDAQSVIAREHGFPSWTALREEVEARTLSFAAAVDEFLRCATGGASAAPNRLLALHPEHRVGRVADRAGSRRRRVGGSATARASGARDRSRADRRTGSRCSTCATRACTSDVPARVEGLVAIARRLLRPRRESERGVSLELAPGASADGAVGRRSARSGIFRSRKCCSRPERIRPTACSMHIAGGGGNRRRARAAEPLRRQRERDSRRRAATRAT